MSGDGDDSNIVPIRGPHWPLEAWARQARADPAWAARQLGDLLTRALHAELMLSRVCEAAEKGRVPPLLIKEAQKVAGDG